MKENSKKTLFYLEEFMDYLRIEEMDNEGFTEFSQKMIENLVEYGVKNHSHSKDKLAWFISDIIPYVDAEEVARFCDTSILTKSMQKTVKEDKLIEEIARLSGESIENIKEYLATCNGNYLISSEEYMEDLEVKGNHNISLEEFHNLKLNKWTYPLSDMDVCMDHELNVILVEFPKENGLAEVRISEL